MRAIEEVEEAIGVPAHVASIRSAGFHLLLEHGGPVDRAAWAERAGVDVGTLDELLEGEDLAGRVRLDAEGRLLGIAGLSVTPTRHEITIGGVTLWTWCALDAVGIFGALEADGTAVSTSPLDDTSITVRFASGVPDSDAVLFVTEGYDGGAVVDSWCPTVNFFPTRDDAVAWATQAGHTGDVVAVRDIAPQATGMWLPVVERP